MSAHDDRGPGDELTRRYIEANAQDTRRPGTHVRQAVQAHARAVLAARLESQSKTKPENTKAANQSRWKVSMLASIALAGLTGLLVLQFDRSTPEEKELALGQPRATAPVMEQPASAAVREAAPAPLPQPPAATTQASTSAKSKAAPTQGRLSRNSQAMPEQESAAATPAPFPASPPAAAMPAPPATADRAQPALAPAPAPATEARSQAARPQAGLAAAPRARTEASGFVDARAALLDAARSGRSADIVQLVRQGASLDATDEAGRTPLMLAAINGHEAAAQQLLALGADRSATDREGLTALAHARRLGLGRIATLIEAVR